MGYLPSATLSCLRLGRVAYSSLHPPKHCQTQETAGAQSLLLWGCPEAVIVCTAIALFRGGVHLSTYFMAPRFLFCSTAIMLSIWLLNKIMRKFTFSVFSPRLNKMPCTYTKYWTSLWGRSWTQRWEGLFARLLRLWHKVQSSLWHRFWVYLQLPADFFLFFLLNMFWDSKCEETVTKVIINSGSLPPKSFPKGSQCDTIIVTAMTN